MPLTASRKQSFPTALLNQTMNVYQPSDDFTAPTASGVKCRLGHINTNGAVSAPDRAELQELRRLFWVGAAIAEGSQVEIAGQRWNTVKGTFAAPDAAAVQDADLFRCCDVRPD